MISWIRLQSAARSHTCCSSDLPVSFARSFPGNRDEFRRAGMIAATRSGVGGDFASVFNPVLNPVFNPVPSLIHQDLFGVDEYRDN